MRDAQRVGWIQDALAQAQLDALVCALPAHVLMTTGYWPVVGTSISVTNSYGQQFVIVPEDEQDLATCGWAEVLTYKPSGLDTLAGAGEAAVRPLAHAMQQLQVTHGRIGFERGPAMEPAPYAALHLFGGSIVSVIHAAAASASLMPADDLLVALGAYKTPTELARIQRACRVAEMAFGQGAEALTDGISETTAAALFRGGLSIHGIGYEGTARADGFVFCMSGTNSAMAHGAYARSRQRNLENGDLALIHCNSYADGYWTDITRTYCVGEPSDRILSMYEAVLAARTAALRAIGPGVVASEVDYAAREKLTRRGYGDAFKHSTGHGVGFAAISSNARPRIHPKSQEVLEVGMVFNVEPAVYVKDIGGIRHCDVVTVTDSGCEILTPFHNSLDDLLITDEMLDERRQAA